MRLARSSVFALALSFAALGAACGTSSAGSCFPGDQTACSCAGGGQGFRTCGAEGTLGACACGPSGTGGAASTSASSSGASTSTSSASSASSASGSSGGTDGGKEGGTDGAFLSPCTTNADCASGLCWDYPSKGPHCTKMCTTPSDCPPPSPGCNPQGVCRAP